ncbi:glycosyltransferase [Litoreibacter sp.]|nr:glycosyltransferase [Litoreibacter sp.]
MKISIVIPTRERCQYLKHSIRTALEIDDPDVEIVVSDNASSDDTRQTVETFNDPRLVYVNTERRVSMRQNFERAFEATTGDYLIFFGDDDGILPGQFPFLRQLLETHKPDGLSWRKATYGWPVGGYNKKPGGVRFYRDGCFGISGPFRAKENLANLKIANVTNLRPVPDIYHGCLSRDYMIQTAIGANTIFDSAIPDVNLTYRSILKDGNFFGVDHPFSINGHSPASTGGGFTNKKNSEPKTSTSQTFASENQADPVSDVLQHAGSIPLAFFSTLETLRRNHDLHEVQPDYNRWYRFIVSSTGKNSELAEKVRGILTSHATETGTLTALTAALQAPLQAKRSMRARAERAINQFHSFRLSTEEGSQNTILTTAHTIDAVLADDFGAVLAGDVTPRAAWAKAKRRSKAFQRQL